MTTITESPRDVLRRQRRLAREEEARCLAGLAAVVVSAADTAPCGSLAPARAAVVVNAEIAADEILEAVLSREHEDWPSTSGIAALRRSITDILRKHGAR